MVNKLKILVVIWLILLVIIALFAWKLNYFILSGIATASFIVSIYEAVR